MYLDEPPRPIGPLLRNADDRYGRRLGIAASELFLHSIGNSLEMVCQFSTEITFRHPADLVPMSLNNQCILVHYTWLVSLQFVHRPNGTRILVLPTLCYSSLLCKIQLSFRITYWFDWKNPQLFNEKQTHANIIVSAQRVAQKMHPLTINGYPFVQVLTVR